MRTYPIICPSCQGRGSVPSLSVGMTSSLTDVCPACNGAKTVMCNETEGFFPKSGITDAAKCPTCQGHGGIGLDRVYS